MRRRWLQIFLPLLVVALAVGLRLNSHTSPFIDRFSGLAWDAYQRAAPRPYEPVPVRVVAIDEASLREFGQWPWPRTLTGALIEKISAAGAASIGLDIVFAEPDRTSPRLLLPVLRKELDELGIPVARFSRLPDHDALFAETIAKANVAVGVVLKDGVPLPADYATKAAVSKSGKDPFVLLGTFEGLVPNLSAVQRAAKGSGFLNRELNNTAEPDRIVRRVPLMMRFGDRVQPSLAAETLRLAVGGSYLVKGAGANMETGFGQNTGIVAVRIGSQVVPTDAAGRIWLHHTREAPARTISAASILRDDFDPARLAGHIVLVGATFEGSNDFVATPLTALLPGVEVHAQILEQILLDWFLLRPDWAMAAETVFMVVASLLLMVVLPYAGAIPGALIAAGSLAAAFTASWVGFTDARLLIDPVYPAIVIAIVYVVATLLGYLRTERQQRWIRSSFARYVSPHLVDELARNPQKLVLGGERRTLTLLFCDIRGFTSIAESLSAEELTKFVNEFLTPMSDVILRCGGTVDKYIGDCIMAFWNAPLDDPDHARHAVEAAQAMRGRLVELNAFWAARAAAAGRSFTPVTMGIGINTGECCVGNMGSDQRCDYSALGDAVNLASRLESLTKAYGVDLIVSESTAALLSDWPLLELDLVAVKGKTRPVRIHTLRPGAAPSAHPAAARHGDLLAAYRRQDWATALRRLEEAGREEGELEAFYAVYRQRIERFLAAPPPADWDGVFVAVEK